MLRTTDERVHDPLVDDEIALYGELVIAASESQGPLSMEQLDAALGLSAPRDPAS